MALFSKRHYVWLAKFVNEYDAGEFDKLRLANYLAEALTEDNWAFDRGRFIARARRQIRVEEPAK